MSRTTELLTAGTRLHQDGQLPKAEAAYRQVLVADPFNAQALYQLGVLVMETGRLPEALRMLQQAIAVDGSQAPYFVNLGEAWRRSGDLVQAIECNRRAAQLAPALPAAQANLGLLHEQLGQRAQAIVCFERLTELLPDDPQSWSLLGRACAAEGELARAERCLRRAVQLAESDPRSHVNLGVVLQVHGRLAEAAECHRKALTLDPRAAAAHQNLGVIWQQLDAPAEAEQHFRAAVAVAPDDPEIHANLAAALVEQCRPDEALAVAQRAIQLAPSHPGAHRNAALALQAQGQLDQALAEHRRAIESAPNDPRWHDALLYLLNFHPDIAPERIAAEHLAWGTRHADPLTAAAALPANDRTGTRRLRVGYVSPYFADHAVTFFVEPVLASHDRSRFQVCCYDTGWRRDETNRRLRQHADLWREVAPLDDGQLARQIRDDAIDILVDLTGHIAGSRLLTFARRPAPVQVTYIGYQATTGMAAMDYRLTDDYCDPPGLTEALHTEQLVRLPGAFFCYLPSADAPPVSPSPANETGYVTFGAFNNFTKVNVKTTETWSQILLQVPRSRLMLLVDDAAALRQRVRAMFAHHGVGSDRIELVARVPRGEYLARMARVDIALDTFPFNGHTTTCDCLWQGLPVVTLSGRTFAQRFGGSALAALGLHSLIASSPAEYVRSAVQLAGDQGQLAELRQSLRQKMLASPLLDAAGFTRNLEAAYRRMWLAWCDGPQ